jgi:hypothetical protein
MRQSLSKKGESPVLLARIPRDILSALKARAKREGLKTSEIVRLALEDYLAKPVKPKGK